MRFISLDDIKKFPIRIDHCDQKNGNIHFVLGIESVMEYIEYLPQYECNDAKMIDRPDFDYQSGEKRPT